MSKRIVVGVVVLAAVVGAYVIGRQGGGYQVLTVTAERGTHVAIRLDKKSGRT